MEELFRLLPDEYAAPIKNRLCFEKLCEVRLIDRAPVRVCYDGVYFFLGRSGLTRDSSAAFYLEKGGADKVVMRACEHSLYTVADTIRRGYISVPGGIRVGVCGTGVISGRDVAAIKDISSVNIRIPHEIKGCAAGLYGKFGSGGLKNMLILSPPGAGKTTLLRDLCRLTSDSGFSVCLIDEKRELAAVDGSAAVLDVGMCTDVMSGLDKPRAMEMCVAYMRPDAIFTDELFGGDIPYVRRAATCGVAVVATAHARSLAELYKKPDWSEALSDGLFSLFAVLSGPPKRDMTVTEGI